MIHAMPHPAVTVILAGLFLLLALASLAVAALRHARPQRDWSELSARTRSWWVMLAVFSAAMLLSPSLSLAFFALISFLALKEYLSLIPTRRADRRVLFWAYLTVPLQYLWIAQDWYGMFIVFIPVYGFLMLPLRMVLIGDTRDFLRAAGTLHWGLMLFVFALSHIAALLMLPATPLAPAGGAGLVLFLVVLTQLNDVLQYLWGHALGRQRVLPTVSPGKTWGGLLGGVATTTALAALAAPWLTPLGHGMGAVAGLLIGLAGFIGDVVISAVKRDLGIKDSGNLIPGHGGLLDRIDSLTYSAPLFFHFIHYLHY